MRCIFGAEFVRAALRVSHPGSAAPIMRSALLIFFFGTAVAQIPPTVPGAALAPSIRSALLIVERGAARASTLPAPSMRSALLLTLLFGRGTMPPDDDAAPSMRSALLIRGADPARAGPSLSSIPIIFAALLLLVGFRCAVDVEVLARAIIRCAIRSAVRRSDAASFSALDCARRPFFFRRDDDPALFVRGDGSAKSSNEIVEERALPTKVEPARGFASAGFDSAREPRLTEDADDFGFSDGFRGADRMCRHASTASSRAGQVDWCVTDRRCTV